VLQCVATRSFLPLLCGLDLNLCACGCCKCVAVCVAVCCSVTQCVAVCCKERLTLQIGHESVFVWVL